MGEKDLQVRARHDLARSPLCCRGRTRMGQHLGIWMGRTPRCFRREVKKGTSGYGWAERPNVLDAGSGQQKSDATSGLHCYRKKRSWRCALQPQQKAPCNPNRCALHLPLLHIMWQSNSISSFHANVIMIHLGSLLIAPSLALMASPAGGEAGPA